MYYRLVWSWQSYITITIGITQNAVECLAQLYTNIHKRLILTGIICVQMMKHSCKMSFFQRLLETLVLLFFYIETFAAALVLAFWITRALELALIDLGGATYFA